MKKYTFLNQSKPLITAMIQQPDPDCCIAEIRNAVCDGADAIGFQICNLEKQYRTIDSFKYIFSYVGNRPIYITNYRHKNSLEDDDDTRIQDMILAVKAGANLVDIMGDTYAPDERELTLDKTAVSKQKLIINKLHELGSEVIISSHVKKFLTKEELIFMAKEQEARGADICKIVSMANTEEELYSNIESMLELKKVLHTPIVFLANGSYCKLQRIIGPMLGAPMVLCVHHYEKHVSKEQPVLRNIKAVFENMNLDHYRNS